MTPDTAPLTWGYVCGAICLAACFYLFLFGPSLYGAWRKTRKSPQVRTRKQEPTK